MTNSSAILALVALALISSSAAFAPSTALAGLGRRQPHLQSQQRRQAPAALNMALASVATSKLLEENKASVAAVATKTGTGEGVYDDLWLLRYVVAAAGDEDAAAAAVQASLDWRKGEGKAICEAAAKGVAAAKAGGGWDNDALFAAAPHADAIKPYISPSGSQILTLKGTTGAPYLIKVVRAAAIDDKGLMAAVTLDQLQDFFLFSYEANAIAIDDISRSSGTFYKSVVVNDLSGINLFGDATFRNALAASSKKANAVGYQHYMSATILVNLPSLLGALVSLFKPLFPKPVQKKLKFEQGPLKDVGNLKDLIPAGAAKVKFLKQIDDLLFD